MTNRVKSSFTSRSNLKNWIFCWSGKILAKSVLCISLLVTYIAVLFNALHSHNIICVLLLFLFISLNFLCLAIICISFYFLCLSLVYLLLKYYKLYSISSCITYICTNGLVRSTNLFCNDII